MGETNTLLKRFMDKVLISDGCWEWTASRDHNGYGKLNIGNRRHEKASRIAYRLFCGRIPIGKMALHHCDNPGCVNPSHLYLGTQKENAHDRNVRGRTSVGSKHPGAILSESDVVALRATRDKTDLSFKVIGRYFGVSGEQVDDTNTYHQPGRPSWRRCRACFVMKRPNYHKLRCQTCRHSKAKHCFISPVSKTECDVLFCPCSRYRPRPRRRPR